MLLAVDIKESDFEWSRVEETPVEPHREQPAAPPEPTLPKMRISAEPISFEELAANCAEYQERLLATPGWAELVGKEIAEKKAARIAARRQRKEQKAA